MVLTGDQNWDLNSFELLVFTPRVTNQKFENMGTSFSWNHECGMYVLKLDLKRDYFTKQKDTDISLVDDNAVSLTKNGPPMK